MYVYTPQKLKPTYVCVKGGGGGVVDGGGGGMCDITKHPCREAADFQQPPCPAKISLG